MSQTKHGFYHFQLTVLMLFSDPATARASLSMPTEAPGYVSQSRASSNSATLCHLPSGYFGEREDWLA